MKSKLNFTILCISLSLVFIYGCSTNQPNVSNSLQIAFQKQIDISDVNKSLKISQSDSLQNKFGSDINFIVQNMSSDSIFFLPDMGTKLFLIRNEQWVQINNGIDSFGSTSLSPKSEGLLGSQVPTTVRPEINPNFGVEKEEVLRVFVAGTLIKNGKQTDIPVGAYVDVFIAP